MTHSHGHGHGPGTAAAGYRGRLAVVLGITSGVFVAQLVGGLLSGSLALIADAAHMLTDATGVAVALLATTLALRPPTPQRTFGLQRAEILRLWPTAYSSQCWRCGCSGRPRSGGTTRPTSRPA